ncbi:MAG: hypothetical protein KME14_20335 [Tildeniella torsiva UHER 1998/13D]|jgi:hypothetical protein|nr:hypothetical protein [Tildeniella torsiva UHER 1998/13D]
MTNDLLTAAVLIIAIAIMSASMGMMFGAMYEGFLARKDDRGEFPSRRVGGGTRAFDDDAQADKRGEFPGQRRGGGTHAVEEFEIAGGDRGSFPGRRQGGGGGDNGGSDPAKVFDESEMDTLEEDYSA